MALLNGPCYEPKSGSAPDSLVIMLHGLGSSGDDLIQLASFWGESLPNTIFYSPNAPQPFDQAPFGFQWFSRRDEETRKNGVKEVAFDKGKYKYHGLIKILAEAAREAGLNF